MLEEISPFDILSGKVAKNENGTFWFKEPGCNMRNDGTPITERLHRDNDLPAVVRPDSSQMWWYKNGKQHRENGPAYVCDGIKEWYKNSKLHNLNGPAVILSSGIMQWHIEDVRYSEEEFNEAVNEYRNKSV